jgi:hypothetical protein
MTYYKRDFYKYIAPHARSVPEPTVEDTVEDIVIDFCNRTSVYRQWLEDHIFVDAGDTDVELDPPRDTAIVEIMAVQKVDESGDPYDLVDPDSYIFSNQIDDTPKLLFVDPATEGYEARVRVALKPEVGFETLPNWLYERWRDVIVAGVLAKILSMRSKPWYAQGEANQYLAVYMNGINQTSRQAILETINKVARPASRYI